MSTALSRVMSRPNLERAWQWTRTNTERAYRGYCADIWRASSLAIDSQLERIRIRLRSGAYEPEDSTKLFLPKPSGVQRPYTILSVSDQIVYQAFANVIAERLVLRVHDRYNKSTFGHLYAGKASPYFYRHWKRSYRRYTDAMRDAFEKGFVYAASFDLTACYDSIDHAVIEHSLLELRLDTEFIAAFLKLLSHWTGYTGGRSASTTVTASLRDHYPQAWLLKLSSDISTTPMAERGCATFATSTTSACSQRTSGRSAASLSRSTYAASNLVCFRSPRRFTSTVSRESRTSSSRLAYPQAMLALPFLRLPKPLRRSFRGYLLAFTSKT
jgi:hypothetical protein